MKQLLDEHRGQLDSLTDALLRAETLDEDAAYEAAQVPHGAADISLDGSHRNFRTCRQLNPSSYR